MSIKRVSIDINLETTSTDTIQTISNKVFRVLEAVKNQFPTIEIKAIRIKEIEL